MKRLIWIVLLALLLLLLLGTATAQGDVVLRRAVLSGGGAQASNSSISLGSTMGQPLAGRRAGNSTVLYSGFWVPWVQRAVFLPLVAKDYFLNPCEDNDSYSQACGPLLSEQTQRSYPDDAEDWFYADVPSAGSLTAVVTNYTAQGDLLLYAASDPSTPIAQWGQGGSTMSAGPVSVPAGRYYIRVYTAGGFNTGQLYNLVVTYP